MTQQISPDDISRALEQAGYPVGNGYLPPSVPSTARDPAWDALGVRMTETNRVDLEMSGEFRRY